MTSRARLRGIGTRRCATSFRSETLYERLLPVPSHVALPSGIARSETSRALLQAAVVHAFDDNARGLSDLADAIAGEERAYGSAYFPDADALMHFTGPDAPEVAELMEQTLDAIAATRWPEGTLVLLTADHGMEGISPERTTYVNVVWPELAERLAQGADGKPLAPAGSVSRPLPARAPGAPRRGRRLSSARGSKGLPTYGRSESCLPRGSSART